MIIFNCDCNFPLPAGRGLPHTAGAGGGGAPGGAAACADSSVGGGSRDAFAPDRAQALGAGEPHISRILERYLAMLYI